MSLSERVLEEFMQRRLYHYSNLLDAESEYDRKMFDRYTAACMYLALRKSLQGCSPEVAQILVYLYKLPESERQRVKEQVEKLLGKNI